MERALHPHILLGMPHLTPFGLARTWLLKELGHRHWLLLARRLGLEDADFRAPDGGEAYPATSALKVDARLSRGRANTVLSIRSDLYPVSNGRMESVHCLAVDGAEIGMVVVQSVFVSRAGKDKGSIGRSLVKHFRPEGAVRESLLSEEIAGLRQWAAPDDGFKKETSFCPCPFEEFNGAGLLYCAEYAALVGRAFSTWGEDHVRHLDRPLSLLFLGNIEGVEALRIGLHHEAAANGAYKCTIQRLDGSPLAHVACG
ncbi:Pnap_2097 family protein [Pseudochelatococcus sp. B33]